MNYQVSRIVYYKVLDFYTNVAKKYKHVYSYEDIQRDYGNAIFSIKKIENGLLRRSPSIKAWRDRGLYMATSKDGRWNYAYRIDGDTVYVEDACHGRNIHETILSESEALYGRVKARSG